MILATINLKSFFFAKINNFLHQKNRSFQLADPKGSSNETSGVYALKPFF